MSLIKCPECEKEISDKVSSCPHCGYPLKKKAGFYLNKKIVGILIAAALVLIVAIITFVMSNNGLSKAKKYYENGNISEFQTLKPKLKSDEIKEFSKYLETEAEKIKQDYISKTISFEDAVAKLETLIEYSDVNHITNYNEILTEIETLNASSEAYRSAQEAYEQGNYIQAYSNYAKVIKEDDSYEDAQNKMKEMQTHIIDEYINNAEQYANDENYSKALSEISLALKYSEENEKLITLKKQYEGLKEKQDKEKEEEEKRNALLTEGKVITGTSIEATFKAASLTMRLNPDSASGFYSYYSAKEGEVWFDLRFRIKNIGTIDKSLDGIVSDVKVIYNNDYTYDRYTAFVSTGKDIDQIYSWDSLEPLRETTYHLIVPLPVEVKDSNFPLEIEFILDGEKQYLQYR